MNQHEHSISHSEGPSSCSDRTLNPLPHHQHCASSPYILTCRPFDPPTHIIQQANSMRKANNPPLRTHSPSHRLPQTHNNKQSHSPSPPQRPTLLPLQTVLPTCITQWCSARCPAETPDTLTHHASFLHPPCPPPGHYSHEVFFLHRLHTEYIGTVARHKRDTRGNLERA